MSMQEVWNGEWSAFRKLTIHVMAGFYWNSKVPSKALNRGHAWTAGHTGLLNGVMEGGVMVAGQPHAYLSGQKSWEAFGMLL